MKIMRIAMLTDLFYPHIGGCERRFFEIGKRLCRRGHEVHILTLRHDASLPKEETIEGIHVHRIAYSGNYISPTGFRSLSGVLKYSFATLIKLFKQNFDVYYFNQWPLLHSILTKPVVSPVVQEWCEVWYEKIVLLEKLVAKVTNYHVAVSFFTKQRLIRFLKIDPLKIVVIPNGVDYVKFSSTSRKKWGKIVFVGRLFGHKHVDLLINAFYKIKQKLPEIELHIIGSGPMSRSLVNLASKLKDVFVHGSLSENEMLSVLKNSWLFVTLSEREGFGVSALEAMAAGIPVITANYPNNAIKHLIAEENGLVVPPTIRNIALAIERLFTNEELWQTMSFNACSFARRHDWNIITSEMENYLGKIAENVCARTPLPTGSLTDGKWSR